MKFDGEFFMRLLNQSEIYKRHFVRMRFLKNKEVTIYVHSGHVLKL